MRASLRRIAERMMAEYFPVQMSVLDRDGLLSLVQEVIDFGSTVGMRPMEADQVLRLIDRTTVEERVPSLRPTLKMLWLGPHALVRALTNRQSPSEWISGPLDRILKEVQILLQLKAESLSESELLAVAAKGIALRDAVFVTRQPHFLIGFLLEAALPNIPGLGRRIVEAGSDLSNIHHPTATLRHDLRTLADLWESMNGGDPPGQIAAALEAFMAKHGGRGSTFVPLISDRVWDVAPEDVLAMVTLLASTRTLTTTSPTPREVPWWLSKIVQGLREFRASRDWVVYAYEQTTRVCRRAFFALGERLVSRGALSKTSDILHCTLSEIGWLISTPGAGPHPDPALLRARRGAYRERLTDSHAVVGSEGKGILYGYPASRGEHEGSARVITQSGDFGS